MNAPAPPSFFARLWLAIVCFFRIVFDAAFASSVAALRAPRLPPAAPPAEHPTLPSTPFAISAAQVAHGEAALRLLAMLQREGRFVDFCEEEISGFSDAQVGAAARTVHGGCGKALRETFSFAPVRSEGEGEQVSLPGGFDPAAVRLTGNVVGSPPFRGILRHHGWKVTRIRMPAASGDPLLIAPAEVELP